MYEKLLAPSGIVECVNHCVEQKGFVIMEASRQLQQGRELRVDSEVAGLLYLTCLYEKIQLICVSMWQSGYRFLLIESDKIWDN